MSRTATSSTAAIRRRAVVAAVAATAGVLFAGCGQAREQALCGEVEDLKVAVERLRDIDAGSVTAGDVRAVADAVLAGLDQVQAVSEGAYDSALSSTRAAVTDLRNTAAGLPQEQLDVARQLVRDTVQDAVLEYQRLQRRIEVVCGSVAGG